MNISIRQADYEDFLNQRKMTIVFGSKDINDDNAVTPWHDLTWMLKRDGQVVDDTDDPDYNRIGLFLDPSDARWRTEDLQEWMDNTLIQKFMINLKKLDPKLKFTQGDTVVEGGHTYEVFAEITLMGEIPE